MTIAKKARCASEEPPTDSNKKGGLLCTSLCKGSNASTGCFSENTQLYNLLQFLLTPSCKFHQCRFDRASTHLRLVPFGLIAIQAVCVCVAAQ